MSKAMPTKLTDPMTDPGSAAAAGPATSGEPALSVDGARLWQSLMELAQIGATPKGGVCRLALTDLDREARDLFVRWARELECEIRIDRIGNIFARRPGSDPHRGAVATGSHLDTQPTGGRFDGCYGVLAGIEVLRTVRDAGIRTEAPLEVCVWTNEEGSRFVPVMMGSGVYAGAFGLDHALAATDRDGRSVAACLSAIGYDGATPATVADGAAAFDAYFEAHIEQGPILEAEQVVIGAVIGALGQRWYDVTVTGQEAHAGPTPMHLRRDALLAASRLVTQVNQIALAEAPHGRGTVGSLAVHPDSRNVIPGSVKLTIDFRHADDAGLLRMDAALKQAIAVECDGRGIEITAEQVVYFPPAAFDRQLLDSIRAASRSIGIEPLDIVSGAGHDAVYAARVAPTAMIFIPCKDGISHNEIEDAQPEHVTAGADVLLRAMLARAGYGG